jgi:hypothetical protein
MNHPSIRIALAALILLSALLIAVGGVAGQGQAEQAELSIVQPDYVKSDVTSDASNGTQIYQVTGPRHVIGVSNVEQDTIIGYGVSDGEGSLEYDSGLDAYIYTPAGNGTATLYWRAKETDGNTTRTQRYEAVIQTEKTGWVHRTGAEEKQLREKANKYSEIEREVNHLAPDRSVDDVISSALTYYRFFDSPFSTLFNDMRGILLMLALRPGGWVIGGVFLLVLVVAVAGGARYRNRTQKQFGDIGDIEVELTEAYIRKAEQILSNCDYNDFLPDGVARAMRDTLGRNPWIGFKNYLLLRSPTSTKGLVLKMMAEIGYEGRYTTTPDGSIKNAWVEHPRDRDDDDAAVADCGEAGNEKDLSALAYETDDDRAFINAISGDDLDFEVFHHGLDFDDISFPISNREVDRAELLDELNPHFPDDFEDEEHLARALGELVRYVVNHEHTDEWGRSRGEHDLLSFLGEMDSVLADEADFPLGHVQRRMLVYIADNMETESEMTETVDRLQEEGV